MALFFQLTVTTSVYAQTTKNNKKKAKNATKQVNYTTYANDPYHMRQYTLSNGLTVMFSVNKAEPKIQTYIAVKAGSKNDPATHTGLAHYLEHMLFKGTDKFGSQNWKKERPLLQEIETLYDRYNGETDPAARAEIYKEIDAKSGEAAKYAIANEYDKMLQGIGATGTNAFTSVEQTVYTNIIPSNQLENWLKIETERFRYPVFRIFHTELEAVYEEKNRGLDNDAVKVEEALLSGLFSHHPYGTQTTIGTIEHLKNPSLKEIRKYYDTYYVPNNMAIIMAGDFEPETAIKLIEKYFGSMEPGKVPDFSFAPEDNKAQPIVKDVYGPRAEYLAMGFRTAGAGTEDALKVKLLNAVLFNGRTGLIDINLVKFQKVLDAATDATFFKDYGYLTFYAYPAEGQTLEQVRALLWEQIEKLKSGDWDESLLPAIINNMEVAEIQRQENNAQRVYLMMDAFTTGRDWQSVILELKHMRSLTKADIMEMARRLFPENGPYVVVNKRAGEDKNIQKVEKPLITPVSINREAISPFAREILAAPVHRIKPNFVDFSRDLELGQLRPSGIKVVRHANAENSRFTLTFVIEIGKEHQRTLSLALAYLDMLGTDKYSASELSRAFYNLASSYTVTAGNTRTYITVKGLQANFEKTLALVDHVFTSLKPYEEGMTALRANEIQARQNMMKNSQAITFYALPYFAKYGLKNPLTNVVPTAELDKISSADLMAVLRKLPNDIHAVTYYGPAFLTDVENVLGKMKMLPATQAEIAKSPYKQHAPEAGKVYFANFDMVQANIQWIASDGEYAPELVPTATFFNEYFGGGMGSIVFQTLREAKALAYSTSAGFQIPGRKQDNFYSVAYIGTQADKLHEAAEGMDELLKKLPRADLNLQSARNGLKSQYESNRVSREGVIDLYMAALQLGLNHDQREDVYNALDTLGFNDLNAFHAKYFAGHPFTLLIVGNKEKLDMNYMKSLGTVEELNIPELFGY